MIQDRNPNPDRSRTEGASGLTVLLADDEAMIRNLIGPMLRGQGFNVLEAADGVEALEIAERHGGPIHLLLTDWRMPRLDGDGLIRGLGNGRPEMAILVMSGNMDSGTPYKGPFLSKPFKLQDLARAVNQALESHFQYLTIR